MVKIYTCIPFWHQFKSIQWWCLVVACKNIKILWNALTSTSFVFTELANTIKYGGDFLYNLVFTEWRHCVSQNEVWWRGCYITLFSPSDVIAFHRIRKIKITGSSYASSNKARLTSARRQGGVYGLTSITMAQRWSAFANVQLIFTRSLTLIAQGVTGPTGIICGEMLGQWSWGLSYLGDQRQRSRNARKSQPNAGERWPSLDHRYAIAVCV